MATLSAPTSGSNGASTHLPLAFILATATAFLLKNVIDTSASRNPLLKDAESGTWKQAVHTASSHLPELFRRGTASVRWCEDVVAGHSYNDSIAEFFNTVSNFALIIAALLGLKRIFLSRQDQQGARQGYLPNAFIAAEAIMIFGVAFGSMLFHAHQSRFAQMSDEVPMSFLAASYL
jgi:hypothetical protein